MGQARLRGTLEQRQAEAQAVIKAQKDERDRQERARDEAIMEKWRAMTPEQREEALERAKDEARNYGELRGMFGHDAALMLSMLSGTRKAGKKKVVDTEAE
jgi:hypothetical protein